MVGENEGEYDGNLLGRATQEDLAEITHRRREGEDSVMYHSL